MRQESGMTLIVKRITRITVSLIFLFGVYIMLHGHLTPGGGFAGGVIIALSFIHLVLAFGKKAALKRISETTISAFESIGGVFFWSIALGGLLFSGVYFLNFLPKGEAFSLFSAGTIVFCNIAIFLKVGAGLFAIFVALAFLRMPDEKEEGGKAA
ncbi:MAG: MnhB domain-containing protein [Candidatus Omnitrophica bacterium]|nr:MnhB domain-containing protein [Candidatus Omnitrophota bacterium]